MLRPCLFPELHKKNPWCLLPKNLLLWVFTQTNSRHHTGSWGLCRLDPHPAQDVLSPAAPHWLKQSAHLHTNNRWHHPWQTDNTAQSSSQFWNYLIDLTLNKTIPSHMNTLMTSVLLASTVNHINSPFSLTLQGKQLMPNTNSTCTILNVFS